VCFWVGAWAIGVGDGGWGGGLGGGVDGRRVGGGVARGPGAVWG